MTLDEFICSERFVNNLSAAGFETGGDDHAAGWVFADSVFYEFNSETNMISLSLGRDCWELPNTAENSDLFVARLFIYWHENIKD